MRRRLIIATGLTLAGGLWLAGESDAGTRGGLYDFRYFLGQEHPFAGTAAAPRPEPAPAQVAPSPAVPTAPSAAAGERPQPALREDPLSDVTDGWYDRLYVSVAGLAVYAENFGGNRGGNSFAVDFNWGYGVDVALGTYFTPAFRGEVAFTYRTNGGDSARVGGLSAGTADLNSYSLMVNGYYDFLRDWPIHPYLGGGLGVDFVDSDDISAGGATVRGKDDVELGVQLIVGLAWPITERTAMTLDYRYHASTDDDIFYHLVQGGFRYSF